MFKPPHYGWSRWEHYQYSFCCAGFRALCYLEHLCRVGGKAAGRWCFSMALKFRRGSDALLDRRNERRYPDQWVMRGSSPPQNFWQLLKHMWRDRNEFSTNAAITHSVALSHPILNWRKFMRVFRKRHRGPAEVDWQAYANDAVDPPAPRKRLRTEQSTTP